MNEYKTLIIILVVSVILTSSGCISKSKESNTTQVPERNVTQILENNTEQIQDIMNILISKQSSTYDDNKFIKIIEEANGIIDNNNILIMTAAEKGDFEDIEKYGKNLEKDTTKYMSILKGLTISPKLKKMYSEYYNYLENMNKAGQHIRESAREHKSMNTGSCNNPSTYGEQM